MTKHQPQAQHRRPGPYTMRPGYSEPESKRPSEVGTPGCALAHKPTPWTHPWTTPDGYVELGAIGCYQKVRDRGAE